MLNTIKTLFIFLALAIAVFIPKTSYAWGDQHSQGDGRARHGHDFHFHANPDLTLVSGMDNIDSRVLVDPALDPEPEVMDQPVPEVVVAVPSQPVSSDADGNFVVNVPNNTGGYTPIRIERSGNGYVGPQGEFYYPFPQISQLKAIYGL